MQRNADKDTITTSTLKLIEVNGQNNNKIYCLLTTVKWGINGHKLQENSQAGIYNLYLEQIIS